MPLLPFQLRVAAKCLVVQRRYPLMHVRHRDREHHWSRNFSQSHRREAAEDPDSLFTRFQSSPILRKIADNPEALQALRDVSDILKESGINVSRDRPPTIMQMFQLSSNTKFREAAKRMIEELKKSGVEIDPKNALEILGMKKPPSE